MPYQNIINVDIALQTSALKRAGFGVPIFTSPNRYFLGRTRSYTSLTDVAIDVPEGTNTYAAMQAFFAQSPSPSIVKIGRIEADVTITPIDVADGSVHSFTLEVAEATINVSYTAGAAETEENVVDAFISAVSADVDVAAKVVPSKVGTLSAAVLKLSPVAADDQFAVDKVAGATETFTSTETAGAAVTAIQAEDDDWYFYTTESHTESWVLATAAAIEATTKLYFYSSQEVGALSAIGEPAVETIGKIFELAYLRTVSFWHDTADTTFPECAMIGHNAPYDAGTVTWANLQLNGVSAAKHPTTGLKLGSTEKGYLFDRNSNTTEGLAGLIITREGKVAKGNFIDDIRGSDDLDATMTVDLQRLMASQKGTKLGFTDATGIGQIGSIMQGSLRGFVDRGFLESFVIDLPSRSEVSANDIAARDYSVATWEAVVAGAIHTVTIQGSLNI